MRKKLTFALIVCLLTLTLVFALTACNKDDSDGTGAPVPEKPESVEPEKIYTELEYDISDEWDDGYNFVGTVEKGNTRVRLSFHAPVAGEYILGFSLGGPDGTSARVESVKLNGEDMTADTRNDWRKIHLDNATHIFEMCFASPEAAERYLFRAYVAGGEDLILDPGEESVIVGDEGSLNGGVRRYNVNSEDGILLVEAFRLGPGGERKSLAFAGDEGSGSLDVPCNTAGDVYFRVKNASGQAQAVELSNDKIADTFSVNNPAQLHVDGSRAVRYLLFENNSGTEGFDFTFTDAQTGSGEGIGTSLGLYSTDGERIPNVRYVDKGKFYASLPHGKYYIGVNADRDTTLTAVAEVADTSFEWKAERLNADGSITEMTVNAGSTLVLSVPAATEKYRLSLEKDGAETDGKYFAVPNGANGISVDEDGVLTLTPDCAAGADINVAVEINDAVIYPYELTVSVRLSLDGFTLERSEGKNGVAEFSGVQNPLIRGYRFNVSCGDWKFTFLTEGEDYAHGTLDVSDIISFCNADNARIELTHIATENGYVSVYDGDYFVPSASYGLYVSV